MNCKQFILVLAAATLLPLYALADNPLGLRFQYEPGVEKFANNEWTMDLFGTANIHDGKGLDDARLGLGIGGNYFFSRYFGLGAQTVLEQFEWPQEINGSMYLRIPIRDSGWAPYGFAGFGRQFRGNSQWKSHVGLGAEYRWNHRTGVFGDIRRTFPEDTGDYTLIRFGLRLGF